MIKINHAQTIDGKIIDLEIPSQENHIIDATNLTLFPGGIDPHVHFRTPGMEHKEDWRTAAEASIYGGYTTVFDMPNTLPPTFTADLLREKKNLIDSQLKEAGIPLNYKLFFGADKNHISEIPHIKNEVVGIKIFMGCSTGNLVVDDDESLQAIFSMAASQNLLVAVHAEDEQMMQAQKAQFKPPLAYSVHSQIRNPEVAARAVEKVITLARIYNVKLYILHVSTADEISLIRSAKAEGLPVYAEVTPHHLFLNESHYKKWGGKVVVNPPIRAPHHQQILFEAIHDQIIDTVGSDHAPHTVDEKNKPYGSCPSGIPGIETTLPLLLNAYHEGHLSLKEIVALTSTRAQQIFNLTLNKDIVLVDLNKQKKVTDKMLKTKCGWSPFSGMILRGWPVYTILHGRVYDLNERSLRINAA